MFERIILESLTPPYNNRNLSDKILQFWNDACIKLRVPHFLAFGTCFGLYLSDDYVEDDDDLDVGIICSQYKLKMLDAELISLGFIRSACVSADVGNDINYLFDNIRLDMWYDFSILSYPFIMKLDTLNHNGIDYNIPSNTSKYLSKLYSTWTLIVNGDGNHYKVDKARKIVYKF